MENPGKLGLMSTLQVDNHLKLYRVVDFLNKNLKDKNITFGLSKKGEKMVISIYET